MLESIKEIAPGVPMTVMLTAAAFAIGCLLGFPLMLLRRSARAVPRAVATASIDVIRAVPPITWAFLVYFGLAEKGFRLSSFAAASLTLGLFTAAYMAEIYRSGLLAVHRGQWEAGRALGLSEREVFALVSWPQALRVIVAPSSSFLISLLKSGSIAMTVGLTEVTYRTYQEVQNAGNVLGVMAAGALVYIVLSALIAVIARRLDRRLKLVTAT
jgi:polar amino acid transport system permease protein